MGEQQVVLRLAEATKRAGFCARYKRGGWSWRRWWRRPGARDRAAVAGMASMASATTSAVYLEMQNEWPFFNRKSSFFRGEFSIISAFSIEKSQKGVICIAIRYLPLGDASLVLNNSPLV